ncbi:MAG: hypothetical protein GY737_21420 [Desulfobacteraceae bacterium]|nr:hypothetical protein [Desulfobacteraceae bacterium]
MTNTNQFYAGLAPLYHLIYPDWEKEDFSKQQVKPYGIREEDGIRWLIWQVWDPQPPTIQTK